MFWKVFVSSVLFLIIFNTSATLAKGPVPDQPAPVFSGLSTNGKQINLADFRGKNVVLEWTNHDCPYVRKHYDSGNMQRTQRKLTEEEVVWISIISSAEGMQGNVTAEESAHLNAQRGTYNSLTILDPSGEIGRKYEARTTPHMFLIDTLGVVRYMGAIDDKPSTRASSLEGATNYVLKAWDELKTGDEVVNKSTKPYGCAVKYAM